MKIIIVVAYAILNRVIGLNGSIPWKILQDMLHFKKLTITIPESVVIMGRKTFESFPKKFRPLPDRWNFIVSRNPDYTPSPTNEKTKVFTSLAAAIECAKEMEFKLIFIIGGGEIYKEALDQRDFTIDEVIATEVDGNFEGDTFFPDLYPGSWSEPEVLNTIIKDGDKNSHDCRIVSYKQLIAL
ncbi:MAG TPA: dihydrofolate reductase [Candidatus Paceibacterota bacterium]|nr:dihydrofolate reductase [Candidatus Paceibacterota bacterium]